jgi:hypothetical protein
MAHTTNNIKITQELNVGLDDVLKGVSQLETPDLELFIQKLGMLVARRKATSLPERESALLLKINAAIPKSLQERYEILLKKNRSETITPTEHKELLSVIDKIETKNAKRLEHLIELSQLRGISLDSLMHQLHLNLHLND